MIKLVDDTSTPKTSNRHLGDGCQRGRRYLVTYTLSVLQALLAVSLGPHLALARRGAKLVGGPYTLQAYQKRDASPRHAWAG
jgi:hypothetical protein